MKSEDLKNGDCSLTYPDLKEKRKQIDVVSEPRAMYNSLLHDQLIQTGYQEI